MRIGKIFCYASGGRGHKKFSFLPRTIDKWNGLNPGGSSEEHFQV